MILYQGLYMRTTQVSIVSVSQKTTVGGTLMGDTARRGLEAHTAILHALVAKGEEVLIPWADHLRYDLAFVRYEGRLLSIKEHCLYRVQCKMARLTDDNSCIIFNGFNTIPGESGRRSKVKGYRGDAEYFGVYSSDTGKCYLISVDDVPMATVRLRLMKSRNNQEKGIRWAKDFEI